MIRTIFGAAGLAAGASAAILRRDQCCFELTASGGQSGTVGQLDDGQNRIGGGHPAGSYCLSNGGITDSNGRGCILTPPTTQFQCDTGASPTTGFSVSGSGEVQYNGNSKFYACGAASGEYNIYTTPVEGQADCVEVALSTGGKCSGSGSGASSSGSASAPSAPAYSAPSSSASQPSQQPAPSAPSYSQPSQQPGPSAPSYSQPSQQPAPSAPAYTQPTQQPGPSAPSYSQPSQQPGPSAPAYSQPSQQPGPSAPSYSQPSQQPGPSAPSYSQPTQQPGPSAPVYTQPSQQPSAPSYSQPSQAPGPSAPSYSHPSVPSYSTPVESQPTTKSTVYYTVTYTSSVPVETVTSSSSKPAENTPQQTPPAYTPSQSTPVQSTKQQTPPVYGTPSESQSAPSETPSGTKPAPSASGSACQTSLSGAYQTPHLIVPISSSQPDKAYGTQYNATVSPDECTIFNFDIPQEYSGKSCSTIFLFPEQSQLETSAFTFSGSGELVFSQLSSAANEQTTYNSCPSKKSELGSVSPQPGNSYAISTESCAAGTTQSIEVCGSNGLSLEFFEDWNPSPIGVFITSC